MSRTTIQHPNLVSEVAERQEAFRKSRLPNAQKGIGQFFTPPAIAHFMADMPKRIPKRLRILDPGAGAGILTAAVADRVSKLRSPRYIEMVVYETDREVIPLLCDTLSKCQSLLEDKGHICDFTICESDFVFDMAPALESHSLFDGVPNGDYDLVIMNPPYLKISKSSDYAKAMQSVVHGQPNLYALFMALGAVALRKGGDFVSITPRSFANGPYFRRFRRWMLNNVSLQQLHLFESRRNAFADSGVLQENIISHAIRGVEPSSITVSHGSGANVLADDDPLELKPSFVIDDSRNDCIIRVPVTEKECQVVEKVESWPDRFDSLGLRVSTGPVVMFRATEYVRRGHEVNGNIPLLSVQNVHPFETVWPVESERKNLSFIVEPNSENLLVAASNYVLIRRFSAKEEARRLTASPVYADSFDGPWLAIENHLNYIFHADRELTREETDGIVAVLNSQLLDTYFRTISGNTQVNATEVRAMPFPSLQQIADIGSATAGATIPDALEKIVISTLP